jgi:hypothetical protein
MSTAAFVAAVMCASAVAGEIGFVEDFALAVDRDEALKQLIPGTREYYYYTCLHLQNEGRNGELQDVLAKWIGRYGRTSRVREIVNRQALLGYEANHKNSLEFIRDRLDINFNHQRTVSGQKTDYPTKLDQDLIGREALKARAFSRYSSTLGGFEDTALEFLVAEDLSMDRLRELLKRLDRPDHKGLPALVVKELKDRYSRGFGSLAIHDKLLLEQLEEVQSAKPDVKDDSDFISAYVRRLHPNPDVDWMHSADEMRAYFDRLQEFVAQLSHANNSLKAHVAYHRLAWDRTAGTHDKALFMEYVKLPKNASYMEREYLKRLARQVKTANLGEDYSSVTLFPPVNQDEPLVREYLAHFFRDASSYAEFKEFIEEDYLKEVFAETKILAGVGDMEQWYSMLDNPSKYQRLKERVDIEFAPTNKKYYGPDDDVSLQVYVKNVEKLIVKVFELSTTNYYRDKKSPIDTAIDLDGLVANTETIYTYDLPPVRREMRTFAFPDLSRRGVYVVEFIGNGRSSRALVRKGQLRLLERYGVAGHVFTVLDEANTVLKDATIWMDGHEYEADERGAIAVPFTEKPTTQQIVLTHDGFSTLDSFSHQSENYGLVAGMYVERESLIKGGKAEVLVRPALYVNGMPASLAVLEDVVLSIRSTDREGVSSTADIRGFAISEAKESSHVFRVPDDLAEITFTLKATVENMATHAKVDLSASTSYSLNGIDATEKVEDLHLAKTDKGYVLWVLGKTGEARADRPVEFEFKHRDFKNTLNAMLQTDARGRIELGELRDIVVVTAKGPEDTSRTWYPARDARSYQSSLHARSGEVLRVPYMGTLRRPEGSAFSLLELRGRAFQRDRFDALSIKNGFLELSGLGRGDYQLYLKEDNRRIDIRMADGIAAQGHVLSDIRLLETRNPKPLQIESVEVDGRALRAKLANATAFTRVHVYGTRYVVAHYPFSEICKPAIPSPKSTVMVKDDSQFVSGRDIGDEYRYILDRRYAEKYPGNMLKRPGLLLNPWAIRETQTETDEGMGGGAYGSRSGGGGRRSAKGFGGPELGSAGTGRFANLDFLGAKAAVILNLKPDADGMVEVKRGDLGDCQLVYMVAVDPENTVYRQVALPETNPAFEDLRLTLGLDPATHATEKKKISILRAGDGLVIGDITTSDLAVVDSLAKVYSLYTTLQPNDWLSEFSFILNWNTLEPAAKREKYSTYACHELNLFVYNRDPQFFMSVVLPYLRNKKDKTFVDEVLLARDLTPYTKSWAHAQLNVVERALLAQYVRGESDPTARHVRELYELLPPNIERFNHLFKTAIRGTSLDASGADGFLAMREKAMGEMRAEMAMADAAPGAGLMLMAEPAAPPAPVGAKSRAAPRKRDGRARKEEAAPEEAEAMAMDMDEEAYFETDDVARRQAVRQLFRRLDKTKEWVENNYYHLPIEQQNAELVKVNAFWNDYAATRGKPGFVSTNFAWASNSFTEMMLAMSVLDVPLEAKEHAYDYRGARLTITAAGPAIVFHKEIEKAETSELTPILVSQNFFRLGDRYRFENNERLDKYVTDEFVVHTVYGCQVVLTNPTSSPQKLDLLLQIPRGAIPVKNGFYTRGHHVRLDSYSTTTLEYHFYFPSAGSYKHYPVHVAKNELVIAYAKPFEFNVVTQPTKIDTSAWDHISQNGTEDEVIVYLDAHNPLRVKLDMIAWRMRDRAFFERVVKTLASSHVYDHTLWSYGIHHDAPQAVREYLQHCNSFVEQCGAYIDSPLLSIDPVIRRSYQHMEYEPLVNARTHRFGKTRKILNDRFAEQYERFMNVLSYRAKLDDDDLMSVTYYLLLQDRISDAKRFFERVSPVAIPARLQYDYMTVYLDFFTDDHAIAGEIAAKYRDYPVPKWQALFAVALAQLEEIEGRSPSVIDEKDRTQQQTRLAATEPGFEFEVESKRIKLNYQNITSCRVNYYLMDIELLFSRNAFVQEYSGQFSFVRPNETQVVALPEAAGTHAFDIPERFHSSNVLVEIESGGIKRSQTYFANSLTVQLVENYGQLRVTHKETNRPLAEVYVKVYARMQGGEVKFFKDGYTDLRGRFDYVSLSTNELDGVERFSILVLSDDNGGVVREAAPPKR